MAIQRNPHSTVGTMTDIVRYLNLLFATVGEPHCPRSGEAAPSRSSSQILEAIVKLIVDGKRLDISEQIALEASAVQHMVVRYQVR